MKLTHTLCAALLLGALSTTAFAQEKANTRSNKPAPDIAAEPTESGAAQGKTQAKQLKGWLLNSSKAENASAKPDCAVAVSAKGGQGPATPAEGCGKEKRALAKKPCKNGKGVKCPKAEKYSGYLELEGIEGEAND